MHEVSHYLLYFGLTLSSIGYLIMGLSFCYFVPRAVCGSRSTACQRLNALAVFAGWIAIVLSVYLLATNVRGLATVGLFCFLGTYLVLMALSIPHFLVDVSKG